MPTTRKPKKKQIIGLSLSFCVIDICEGKVKLTDVKKIVTGTAARTPGDWKKLLEDHQSSYWQKYPKVALRVVERLRQTKRIEQPRNKFGRDYALPDISNGYWVDTKEQIAWVDWMKIPGWYEGR